MISFKKISKINYNFIFFILFSIDLTNSNFFNFKDLDLCGKYIEPKDLFFSKKTEYGLQLIYQNQSNQTNQIIKNFNILDKSDQSKKTSQISFLKELSNEDKQLQINEISINEEINNKNNEQFEKILNQSKIISQSSFLKELSNEDEQLQINELIISEQINNKKKFKNNSFKNNSNYEFRYLITNKIFQKLKKQK